MSNRVQHFEIHSGDLDASKKFFSSTFGWEYQDYSSDYALATTGSDETSGINGALMTSRAPMPHQHATVLTVTVDDLDSSLAQAEAKGATVAVPKSSVPGQGHLAYINAPGNVLIGLWQNDPTAA